MYRSCNSPEQHTQACCWCSSILVLFDNMFITKSLCQTMMITIYPRPPNTPTGIDFVLFCLSHFWPNSLFVWLLFPVVTLGACRSWGLRHGPECLRSSLGSSPAAPTPPPCSLLSHKWRTRLLQQHQIPPPPRLYRIRSTFSKLVSCLCTPLFSITCIMQYVRARPCQPTSSRRRRQQPEQP